MNNSECFVVWVHRDAGSIFGAASHPVNETEFLPRSARNKMHDDDVIGSTPIAATPMCSTR